MLRFKKWEVIIRDLIFVDLQALKKMKTEWDNVQFTFVAYRETGISILSAVDDIQVYVHMCTSHSMHNVVCNESTSFINHGIESGHFYISPPRQ